MVCRRLHHSLCCGKKLTPFDLDEVIHGEKVEFLAQVRWNLLELGQDPACIKNDVTHESQRQRDVLTLFKAFPQITRFRLQVDMLVKKKQEKYKGKKKEEKKDWELGLGVEKLTKMFKN